MPGNPHAKAATPIYASHQTHEQVVESLIYTQREAVLALAFEQRTQTLLAVATATFADGSAMFPGQIDSARRQIADRLGMGETEFRAGVGRPGRTRPDREGGTVNWDEQSDRAAIRHYSDWCPDGIQEAHRRGARWQREALLSDEAIERAADILEALDGDDYLTVARVALTAAIGGNDE